MAMPDSPGGSQPDPPAAEARDEEIAESLDEEVLGAEQVSFMATYADPDLEDDVDFFG